MVEIISDNKITKHFCYYRKKGNIEMFVSKAFDDESGKHFLIASIVSIPDLNVEKLQYPIAFDEEKQRDDAYDLELTILWAKGFLEGLYKVVLGNVLASRKTRKIQKHYHRKKSKKNAKKTIDFSLQK